METTGGIADGHAHDDGTDCNFALVTAASFLRSAIAASCGFEISSQSPALKMLRRQLSALRSIQRGRGCKLDDTSGGFFKACRDVEMKINEV